MRSTRVKTASEWEVDPSLDRDTVGSAGSADIAGTIFTKIRASDAFVADVSIINPDRTAKCRPTPNPNVLAELGYAAGFHGWERVVCVVNTAFGSILELPFDIRQRKVVSYELRPGDDKSAARKKLVSMLRGAIHDVLTLPVASHTAHSLVSLDCPLTDEQYELPQIHVQAKEYQHILLHLENPPKKAMSKVHVCYKNFDLFYMPWKHRTMPINEEVAGGYHYYWLTDKQLEDLSTRSHQQLRFIVHSKQCGEHELLVVWNSEGKFYQRKIKLLVKPQLL